MSKKIVISCGPIPARLDSVKFISNRFKGGLAFKTANDIFMAYKMRKDENFHLTIVKWEFAPLPDNFNDYMSLEPEKIAVVDMKDVFDYYKWFEENAVNYDAFIMAAAVANLTPSLPYEGKFPSHNYKVGEKFNIEFEIAPRAIDIIKQKNPRATLIGYKLFDAPSDEQLIDIARHTLNDSKANIIFANTPAEAKKKKIAIMSDGSAITCTFREHVDMIIRAIEAKFFKTKLVELDEETKKAIAPYKAMVEYYETTFDGFGTVAFKVAGGIVTTSRGHRKGPVFVKNVDFEKRVVYADSKATLNAPLLFKLLVESDNDYIVHRHTILPHAQFSTYAFPGTDEEIKMADVMLLGNKDKEFKFNIDCHGYIKVCKFKDVDWEKYYELFPEKYFSTHPKIRELVDKTPKDEILDVGGNIYPAGNYLLDTGVKAKGVENITYEDLKSMKGKFSLVVIKNAINYLSEEELSLVIESLKPDGKFVANTFLGAPELKASGNEVAFTTDENGRSTVEHFLFVGDDVFHHSFYNRDLRKDSEYYSRFGLKITPYGRSSALIERR